MGNVRVFRSPNRRHNRDYFYKYATAEVAQIILATRKLRWSSPIQFNDPFDVTQVLRLNFDAEQLNGALIERFAQCIESGVSLENVRHPMAPILMPFLAKAPIEKRKMVAAGLRDGANQVTSGQIEALKMLQNKWAEIVPNFRILCVSESNVVVPMWAHYADEQRGVVLEFAAVDEVDSAFLQARPVVYQDEVPSIASVDQWVSCLLGLDGVSYMDLFHEYLYVKTLDWVYEKEWRIVSTARPGETDTFQDYGFSPQELTGIYFGATCSENDRESIQALLAHGFEHVRSYRVALDYAQAKINFIDASG